MASSKEFKDFILEQLKNIENITCRAMMGEYLLYCDGILFGGIYDNQLLIKKIASNKTYNLPEEIPYANAKPMLMVTNLDDTEFLCELVKNTCKGFKK